MRQEEKEKEEWSNEMERIRPFNIFKHEKMGLKLTKKKFK